MSRRRCPDTGSETAPSATADRLRIRSPVRILLRGAQVQAPTLLSQRNQLYGAVAGLPRPRHRTCATDRRLVAHRLIGRSAEAPDQEVAGAPVAIRHPR